MPAKIIDGAKCAQQIYDQLKRKCQPSGGKEPDLKPTLAILSSDCDAASRIYVRNKIAKCEEVGISCISASISPHNRGLAAQTLMTWANDPNINGVILQRPSSFEELSYIIPEHKDVDGAMPDAEYDPCTPRGVMHLLHSLDIDLAGLHAVVVGRSDTVGKPMADMLLEADCTVTICHSMTKDLKEITKQADILVSATGRAHLIKADMVKPGAIVIDIGISRIPDPANPGVNKIVGDVDFALVKEVAGYITPVPGGVGPMTIAMLLHNTVAACAEKRLKDVVVHDCA